MRRFIFLVSVFLLVNLSSYTFANEKRFYLCFPLTKNPVLDGKLDDTAWKDIPEESSFVKLGSNSLSSKQTYFKMGYNSEALYIGIKCEEPEIEKVKAELKDMESLWEEDSIEIFIFPKGARNYSYSQFIINTIGSMWNRIAQDRRSEKSLANWQAKTYKGKDYYSMEMRIPFEIFHSIPKKWEEWTGNICRNILTSGDKHTTWGHLVRSFQEQDSFGRIIFAGEGAKDKVTVNFLRKEIVADLESVSALKSELSKCRNKYPSLQKELTSFFKNYEEIKKGISRFDSFSIKEANLLFRKSGRLIKESDKLRVKILLESHFIE